MQKLQPNSIKNSSYDSSLKLFLYTTKQRNNFSIFGREKWSILSLLTKAGTFVAFRLEIAGDDPADFKSKMIIFRHKNINSLTLRI